MKQWMVPVVAGFVLTCAPAATLFAQAPVQKVAIVAVAGCLQEQGAGKWMLVSATEPVPSSANASPVAAAAANASPATAKPSNASPAGAKRAARPAPPPDVPATTSGTNQYQLIGVSEFNLPAYKGHTVIVKALHVPASPVSRLNVTSVTRVAPSCVAAK